MSAPQMCILAARPLTLFQGVVGQKLLVRPPREDVIRTYELAIASTMHARICMKHALSSERPRVVEIESDGNT